MTTIQQLGHRATKSVIALTSRTFILNVINFLGAFVLTIFLTPREFGIFILTSTVVDILTYFSDIGLAGALIQKKTDLEKNEVNATFTIQMGLVSSGIIVALLFSKPIQTFYGIENQGIFLFYALLAAFFFSSLKTIPSVLSERELKFEKIIIPQIVETIVFNVLIVTLAWRGFGLTSYIVAVLARALLGTLTIYLLVSWRPRLYFSLSAVKSLLSFGITYQLNSLTAMFKDRVSLLILGKIIGIEGMGILGWAEKWANLPLRYFLDSTVKVAFPLFSRLQNTLDKAKIALDQAIYFISVLVFPALVGAYLVMPQIIETIPQYTKWEPGLTTFNLLLISAAIASISTFLTNFLTAIGKVKHVLALMVMWTVLTLTLYPLFALQFGYVGVAIASIVVAFTSFVPYVLVKRVIPFNVVKLIAPALVSSAILLIGIKLSQPWFASGIAGIIETITLGILLYGGSLLLFDRATLKTNINKFITYAKT